MILYGLMIAIGFLLLIAPGIYLAMRYGHCLTAMVDRDLGIMDSFQYSLSISTNNRLNLFLLSLLGIFITFAGCLVLCVGLLFALPVIWLDRGLPLDAVRPPRRAGSSRDDDTDAGDTVRRSFRDFPNP